MFNSSLIYELAMLKTFAEPLLVQGHQGADVDLVLALLRQGVRHFLIQTVDSLQHQDVIWRQLHKVAPVLSLAGLKVECGKFHPLSCQQMHHKDIVSRENVRFVMIAGPSSSGKTSFSHRLSIQLRTLGKVPRTIALDNYFHFT